MHHSPDAILISPSAGVKKLPQGVLSGGSTRCAAPAKPELLLLLRAAAVCPHGGLTPVRSLWEEAEGIEGLKGKKERKLLVFRVIIAHQLCIVGEFGAESLLSVGPVVICG